MTSEQDQRAIDNSLEEDRPVESALDFVIRYTPTVNKAARNAHKGSTFVDVDDLAQEAWTYLLRHWQQLHNDGAEPLVYATASEAMVARDKGYRVVKFFPAGPAGGPKYLQALASPLGEMVFCPTGGVSLDNAADYLRLKNVVCVGGSWVAPADAVKAGDWGRIEQLAREAAAIAA